MKDPTKISELFQTKIVHGRTHILSESHNFRGKVYPDPDYMGTGLALVGVLKPGQSLEEFKKEWIERQLK